jgi:N-acetylglutamate synthase-like GNAT family acetyltransferase
MAENAEKKISTPELEGPRALRPEEFSSALDLLASVFRPDGPRDIQKEYPLVLCEENLPNMRVIARGGRIISHASIYTSTLLSGDLSFKIGGINSVVTHPAQRRRGLGGSVMEDCIRVMEGASCHLSILWTQRQDFYRGLGYEPAGSNYLFKLRAADIPKESGESGKGGRCEVLPYSPRHLPDIIDIHGREAFRTERTAKEYEAYLGIPRTKTLLAARDGKVTAYAVMGKGEDLRHCIHEWGGEAQDLLSLAREFAEFVETCGSGETHGRAETSGTLESLESGRAAGIMILAPGHETEFTRLLRRMKIPSAFEYLAMIRVIDVEGLSSVIRDRMSGLLGREFSLRKSESGVRIIIGDEEASLKSGEPGRDLSKLLFGPEPPSSLLHGFSCETMSALDRALPIPLFIWGLDSV